MDLQNLEAERKMIFIYKRENLAMAAQVIF